MKSSLSIRNNAFLLLFALFSINGLVAQPLAQQPPSVSVSGTAEMKIVPDEICVSVSIETRDAQMGHAKLMSDTRVENAIKFLKQNGVKAADIQTGNFNVRPEFNYDPETGQQETVKFYVISRQMEFKLTKADKFDDLLTGLMESGVNYVNEVRLTSTKLRETRDEARRRAARAAREKAELLTGELGAKAGKVISISENIQDYMSNYYGRGPEMYNQNVSLNMAPADGGSSDGSLSVGLISVSATVNATFLIE